MFSQVGIVGHGLIGGSIALALRERMPEVDVRTLDRGDDLAAAAACDLVILAAPVLANLDVLATLRPRLAPHTLITDTGSTKRATLDAAEGLRFVGGHPITGAAGGREAARHDLFEGKRWILTPAAHTPRADVSALSAFVEALGASVAIMDPAAHDRLFASISHLPQLAISALMDVVGRSAGVEGLAHAGAGLRESTRLAASPPGIWRDVVATNRDHVAAALDELITALQALRDDPTGAALERTFESAARWKRALDD